MTPLGLANKYMEIFFSGRDMGRLEDILHEDCQFRGPFYQFDSAEKYITSLKADPPIDCSFKIVHSFQFGNVVNLIYYFSKPGVSTIMSQLFQVYENKITSIVLIFDSAAFANTD